MLHDLASFAPIETPRLTLRLPEERDLDDLAAIYADPETMRYLGGTRDRNETSHGIAMIIGHWAIRGYGLYAVEERPSGRLVGRIGLLNMEGWPALEIGWAIGREFWGKGYATEAAGAVMQQWLPRLRPDRLISIIHVDNERSARLARRLGAAPGERITFMGDPVVLWEHPLSQRRRVP